MEARQGSSTDSRDRELRLRIRVVLQETVKGKKKRGAEIVCDWRINEVMKWKVSNKIIPTKIRLRQLPQFSLMYVLNCCT